MKYYLHNIFFTDESLHIKIFSLISINRLKKYYIFNRLICKQLILSNNTYCCWKNNQMVY